MTFIEVKERNLGFMKIIPGQYFITDMGRIFYDSDSGNRVELSKNIEFIMSRDIYLNGNEHTLYIEMKTGYLLRYESSPPKWIVLGGLSEVESVISKLFKIVNDLAQEIQQLRQIHDKCMKIVTQSGDIRLGNNQEYTMTIWENTRFILPDLPVGITGRIRVWISINQGNVDYGTNRRVDGSLMSLAVGTEGMVEYIHNPLKGYWVMNLTSL